jgi:hypothetical protein
MNFQKKTISEKDIFNGELTTISVEIPKNLCEKISIDYKTEMENGTTSVTFEQFGGAFLQLGYNYNAYSMLRKAFEKI